MLTSALVGRRWALPPGPRRAMVDNCLFLSTCYVPQGQATLVGRCLLQSPTGQSGRQLSWDPQLLLSPLPVLVCSLPTCLSRSSPEAGAPVSSPPLGNVAQDQALNLLFPLPRPRSSWNTTAQPAVVLSASAQIWPARRSSLSTRTLAQASSLTWPGSRLPKIARCVKYPGLLTCSSSVPQPSPAP